MGKTSNQSSVSQQILPQKQPIWITQSVAFWRSPRLREPPREFRFGNRFFENGATMKRIAYVGIFVGLLVSLASAQSGSLGDYARSARKENKPVATKKFDNDNLPKSDKLS